MELGLRSFFSQYFKGSNFLKIKIEMYVVFVVQLGYFFIL